MSARIHPTATVDDGAIIGEGTSVWHQAHVRAGAVIGAGCMIGKNVYVGADVHIGDHCKIQNNALIYEGVSLGDGVFIGPGAIIANDRRPRAVNPDGTIKGAGDWTLAEARIEHGASIGAGAILIPPLIVGAWAMVAAGAVVARDVEPQSLVAGNPARHAGWVCVCGARTQPDDKCGDCGRILEA
ncbi:MAG TPA: acyltransferase [Actinomycetota bacterium]|nr:acyltransferase [Actinomycetota bacterium]